MPRTQNLLEIEHLTVDLPAGRERRRVIHDVSLSVRPGEAVGLVGESGSGKSMTARTVMRLLPDGADVGGRVVFDERPILEMNARALRLFRSREIAMIYQDPRAHINPLRTIGAFLFEALLDGGVGKAEAKERAISTLRDVGIDDAERRLRQYPHQLSGGLLQRVMIAAALLQSPRLILADEPTTALDVTTQQEVMAILDEERRDRGLAMLFITHDLDLATAVTDRIAVMYAGVVVETAPSASLHGGALHPYTVGLLASRPSFEGATRLRAIPGRPVSAFEAGPGCVFASRCPYATELAKTVRPEHDQIGEHIVACHRAEELRGTVRYPEAASI
jgi:oligopeptide/dipeptide ABC transporter ATP-binding protein